MPTSLHPEYKTAAVLMYSKISCQMFFSGCKNFGAMESEETGEERKKISFGLSLADEKIKLIDILSENDDFLVASPFSCDSLQDCFSGDHGGFRLSGFGNSQEFGTTQQKEQNRQPSDFLRPPRPSFLRRSLAWDSAFFNSSGVLEPDELSLINKGFITNETHMLPRTQDIRKRRSESEPEPDDLSLDWFEIQPFEHRRAPNYYFRCSEAVDVDDDKSPESGLEQVSLQNVQALRKVGRSLGNKMKSNKTSTGKSVNVQSGDKMKKETTFRRKQGLVSSPKPPKALARTKNISARSDNSDLSEIFYAKMKNKSVTPDSEQCLVMEKKPASQSLLPAAIASTVSVPFINTKRKNESRRSKLSHSLSASKIWTHSERSKGIPNISPSNPSCPSSASSSSRCSSEPLSSSVSNKQRSNVGLDIKRTFREPFLHNEAKEASDFQSPLSSAKQCSSQATAETRPVGSLSTENFRPSGLRPPSPRIRFFDENTPPSLHGVTRNSKMPQKIFYGVLPDSSISSRSAPACKKLKNPGPEVVTNIKKPKTDHTDAFLGPGKEMCLETGRVGDHSKRPRSKLRLNSSFEEEKRRDKLKSKRCRASEGPKDENPDIQKTTDQDIGKKNLSCFEDQLGNLSRYFEAIDLNQKKVKELKQMDWHAKHNKNNIEKQENQLLDSPAASSKPSQPSTPSLTAAVAISSTRTPLADKTSACNLHETLA